MNFEFNFVADRIIKDKAYPALAQHCAEPYTSAWRDFVNHWPHTVPCELHEHCATHGFPYRLTTTQQAYSFDNFYTIGLGFFDFAIDYFSLLSADLIKELQQLNLRVLFYYHEGDNPFRIQARLNQLCALHQLSTDCYVFVSGNTAADQIRNFVWFPDHELLYWHRNQLVNATSIHLNPRPYRFTILNRTHKWWRATVMADLQRADILTHSQWSYNTHITLEDHASDNPIEIDTLGLASAVNNFLSNGPYTCDSLSEQEHNDHHLHVPAHYTQSYCHLVIETHFDADQSGGAFLTEKTFKPIKHGQPFVIVGAPGSLQALRDLGYRTFDHAVDNRYDLETDNTQRWNLILHAVKQIQQQDPDKWFASCLDDLCHNQQLFLSSKQPRLNMLYNTLRQI